MSSQLTKTSLRGIIITDSALPNTSFITAMIGRVQWMDVRYVCPHNVRTSIISPLILRRKFPSHDGTMKYLLFIFHNREKGFIHRLNSTHDTPQQLSYHSVFVRKIECMTCRLHPPITEKNWLPWEDRPTLEKSESQERYIKNRLPILQENQVI